MPEDNFLHGMAHFIIVCCLFVGVLKDYLRELPEPLVTNALYQMLLDALSVRLPSDPDGSAKLMLSILECLPKANQVDRNTNHTCRLTAIFTREISSLNRLIMKEYYSTRGWRGP